MMNDDLVAFQEAAALLRSIEGRETGRGASAADIERLVIVFGQPVLSSYVAFLREFGWGGVADLEVLGAGPCVPPFLDVTVALQRERHELQPSLASSLLPIQRDGGGGLFCLRPRGPDIPCDVVFWDHEGDSHQVPAFVSQDFGTWLREQLRELETDSP